MQSAVEREQVLGVEHYTLTSVGHFKSVLSSYGNNVEAEEMLRRALNGNEQVRGRAPGDADSYG